MNKNIYTISISFFLGVSLTVISSKYGLIENKVSNSKNETSYNRTLSHLETQTPKDVENTERYKVYSTNDIVEFDKWDDKYAPTFNHIKQEHPDLYENVIKNEGTLLLERLMIELSHTYPESAANIFTTIPEGKLRNDVFGKIIEAWRQRDPIAMFDWLKTQENHISSDLFEYYIYESLLELAHSDPEKAERNVTLLKTSQERNDIIIAMANGWSKKGAAAAFNWLESLNAQGMSSELYQSIYTNILIAYANESPYDAASIVSAENNSELHQQITPVIIESIAKTDINGALDQLHHIRDPSIRATSLFRLASTAPIPSEQLLELITVDPSILTMGDNNGVVLDTVIENIANQTPRLLVDSISSFPTELQSKVISNTASHWFEQDPTSTLQWLESSASGPLYDAAATEVAHALISEDTRQALILTQTISAHSPRIALLKGIISKAPDDQLDTIRSYVNFDEFEATERDQLLDDLEQRRGFL